MIGDRNFTQYSTKLRINEMSFATADLYDKHGDNLQISTPMFYDYGGKKKFSGPAVTVKVFEDNSIVRAALEEPG